MRWGGMSGAGGASPCTTAKTGSEAFFAVVFAVLVAGGLGCGGADEPVVPRPPSTLPPRPGSGSKASVGSAADPVLAELARGGADRLAARLPPIRRLVTSGDAREALAALDALERDMPAPTPESLGLRGRAHQRIGELELAAHAYGRALSLAPDDLAAHGGLAETLLRLGREREALPHLERYASLTPDADERAKARRAIEELQARVPMTVAGSGSPGPRAADPVLDELARGAPELAKGSAVHAQLVEAIALLDAKRYDDAMGALDRAIALAPTDARAYALRGRAHRLAGRLDAASVDAERAIELAPRDAFAFVERGLIALARKAIPAAIAAFDAAGEREHDPAAKARLAGWCDQLRAATGR